VMQSAGKDSAAMLLGLKAAGINHAKCITYEASFRDMESAPARRIAESLGFEHQTVEPDYKKEFKLLKQYQMGAYGITGDFALIPYLAVNAMLEGNDATIIDGLG